MDTNTSNQSHAGQSQALAVDAWLGSSLLVVDAGVRYWEDATVNGVEDSEGTLIPHRNGERWQPAIDLATGEILDWPTGTTADVHYKVCDDGEYWLADETGKRLWKWGGCYVPDDLLCVGDRGYGDYIIFKVGADGKIAGWKRPTINAADWEPNTAVSHGAQAPLAGTTGSVAFQKTPENPPAKP